MARAVGFDLMAPHQIPDGRGGFHQSWRVLGRIWAEIRPRLTPEQAGEVGPANAVIWHLRMRAAPLGDPRRPTVGQRLVHGGRVLSVQSVAECDGGGLWLDLMAKEEAQT